jgi:hypothetical protein
MRFGLKDSQHRRAAIAHHCGCARSSDAGPGGSEVGVAGCLLQEKRTEQCDGCVGSARSDVSLRKKCSGEEVEGVHV